MSHILTPLSTKRRKNLRMTPNTQLTGFVARGPRASQS